MLNGSYLKLDNAINVVHSSSIGSVYGDDIRRTDFPIAKINKMLLVKEDAMAGFAPQLLSVDGSSRVVHCRHEPLRRLVRYLRRKRPLSCILGEYN